MPASPEVLDPAALPAAPLAGLIPFFATTADAGALARLSLAGFGAEAISATTFRRRLTRGHARVLGLREGLQIVAYLLLFFHGRTRRAYVNEVLVIPARRGQGLARWLLQAAEGEARREGMSTLAAHVRVSNTASLRAKLRQGMIVVGRLPAWYPDQEDALYLRRKL